MVGLIQRFFRRNKDKEAIGLLREAVKLHKEKIELLKKLHKTDIDTLLWALESAERGKRNESLPGIF